MKFYHSTDIRYLKPLFKILSVIGNFPPFSFETNSFEHLQLYRLYSLFILTMIVICNSASIYERSANMFGGNLITIIILDVAKQVALLGFNVFAILNLTFYNTKNLRLFLNYFMLVDRKMKNYHKYAPKDDFLHKFIFFNHTYIFFTFIYDSYVWASTYNLREHLCYIFEYFQYYHINIIVSFLYNLALGIKYRFFCLNAALMDVEKNICNNTKGETIKNKKEILSNKGDILFNNARMFTEENFPRRLFLDVNKQNSYEKVKEIREMYSILSDLVEMYNTIYGWLILFISNIVLFSLLLDVEGVILNTNTTYPFIVKFIATFLFCTTHHLVR